MLDTGSQMAREVTCDALRGSDSLGLGHDFLERRSLARAESAPPRIKAGL